MKSPSSLNSSSKAEGFVFWASLTHIHSRVLHLLPVFEVHGPDVAIEEARGVRDGVIPCAGNNSVEKECQEGLGFRVGVKNKIMGRIGKDGHRD